MLTNALLSILIAFLNGVIALLSQQGDVPVNNGLTNAITTAAGGFAAMAPYFPIGLLIIANLFFLKFDGIHLVYKLIRWAYRKIPGIS